MKARGLPAASKEAPSPAEDRVQEFIRRGAKLQRIWAHSFNGFLMLNEDPGEEGMGAEL